MYYVVRAYSVVFVQRLAMVKTINIGGKSTIFYMCVSMRAVYVYVWMCVSVFFLCVEGNEYKCFVVNTFLVQRYYQVVSTSVKWIWSRAIIRAMIISVKQWSFLPTSFYFLIMKIVPAKNFFDSKFWQQSLLCWRELIKRNITLVARLSLRINNHCLILHFYNLSPLFNTSCLKSFFLSLKGKVRWTKDISFFFYAENLERLSSLLSNCLPTFLADSTCTNVSMLVCNEYACTLVADKANVCHVDTTTMTAI